MKFKKMNLEGSDILGPTAASTTTVGAGDLESWRRRMGYLSMFAGVTAIFSSQDVAAAENEKAVPAGVKARAAELVKKLNKGACSRPELLRRQSEYRLTGQKGEFNMVELLAGADDCPGAAIPSGVYTAATPFTDTGSTTGANDTVTSIPLACNGTYSRVAGPDHIYSFTLSARGANPEIRVSTNSATYDLSIYVLNGSTAPGCPAGTGTTATNCITGADDTFFPNAVEVLDAADVNSLPLNVPLHLFVDSYYSAPGGNGGTGNGPYTVRIQDVTVGGGPMPPANDAPVDFNADGQTDFVMVRNVGGGASGQLRWYTAFNDGFPTSTTDWGIASDQIIPADFDGDGDDDFAVFRPGAQGTFFIVRSTTNTVASESFGQAGDDATVVGDYTGDNKDDLAVYRAGATPGAQSTWHYRTFDTPPGFTTVQWGQGGDFPAPGDYDGDNRYDFVVQRPDANGVNGRFFKRMASGEQSSEMFGLLTDDIVPGDYDDDGKTDLAVVRNDGGFLRWDFEPSGTAGSTVVTDLWGVSATDITTQGDYDGDGRTDYSVYRPGNPGMFFIMTVGTRNITFSGPWGVTGDYPVANYNTH